mgnify:CR=1 FL=1
MPLTTTQVLFNEFSRYKDDFLIRIENSYLGVYSNDKDWLKRLSYKIKNRKDFTEPRSDLVEFLRNNTNTIIVNNDFANEFTEVSEKAEEFPHGFTAGGHPVGCAIALKAIDVIINEGLLENVRNVSPYFHERLQEFNEYDHIGETRGIGLMAALEMVKNKDTKEPFEGHLNMGDKVANMSIDNGLICRPLGPAIVLCPQFIINRKQIDEMFDSLHSTLKQAFN